MSRCGSIPVSGEVTVLLNILYLITMQKVEVDLKL